MTRTKTTILRVALALLLVLGTLQGAQAALPTVTILGTLCAPLRAPGKMALDAAGNLFVADVQNGGIVKFDAGNRPLGVIAVPGVVRSVALTANGNLLVSHGRQVTSYRPDGAALGDLTGYSFTEPNGIALDATGNIYVADSKANRIAVFTSAGSFRSSFGSAGKKQGELNFPTALSYERNGNLIAVADTLNNRIQFFDTEGTFKRSVGGPSTLSGPLSFTYPNGVAFDYASGVRMYVADGFQSSVQVIDLEAQPKFVGYLGSYGTATGQFRQLADVLFDQQSRMLVTADATGTVTFFGLSNQQGEGASALGQGGTAAGGSGGTAQGSGGTGGAISGGSTGSSSATSGSTGGTTASWQYPTGVDCRHARAGSVVCR